MSFCLVFCLHPEVKCYVCSFTCFLVHASVTVTQVTPTGAGTFNKTRESAGTIQDDNFYLLRRLFPRGCFDQSSCFTFVKDIVIMALWWRFHKHTCIVHTRAHTHTHTHTHIYTRTIAVFHFIIEFINLISVALEKNYSFFFLFAVPFLKHLRMQNKQHLSVSHTTVRRMTTKKPMTSRQ